MSRDRSLACICVWCANLEFTDVKGDYHALAAQVFDHAVHPDIYRAAQKTRKGNKSTFPSV